MTPHSNDHLKTKEGYLIALEEILNLKNNLPKRFYRLDIESARELHNAAIISGRIGFIEKCNELEIEIDEVFDE